MNKKVRDHFKQNDPVLYELIDKIEQFEFLTKTDNYFEHLCDHIASQQLSVAAGNTIFNRFRSLFPNGEITPEFTLTISDETLRACGFSRPKVMYIKDLARKVVEKEVDLLNLSKMTDEEVILELVKIKGIGKWTAEMFLMSALAREDIFSFGDLGIRKAMQGLYGLSDKFSEEEAIKIAEKWSPYKTYACKILWRSLKL